MCLDGEPGDVLQTFQLLSDGKTLYWLYALQTQETVTHPVSGDKIKQYPLYLHSMHVEVRDAISSLMMLSTLYHVLWSMVARPDQLCAYSRIWVW